MTAFEKAIKESQALEAKAAKTPYWSKHDGLIMSGDKAVATSRDYDMFSSDFTTQQDKDNAIFIAHSANELHKFREAAKLMRKTLESIRKWKGQDSSSAEGALAAVDKLFEEK